MPLRQFLYYNEPIVDDFLAQLEGGQVDEVRRRERADHDEMSDDRDLVPSPLRPEFTVASSSAETQAIVRQVRASKFERLHTLLTSANELVDLEAIEEVDALRAVRRGSILSADAQVSIPPAARLLAGAGGLASLASIVRAISPDSVDAKADEAISGISALNQLSGSPESDMTTVATPIGAPMSLVMRLAPKFLLGTLDDLEGEATVVGKVTRKLKVTDRELVLDLPALSLMGRDARRSIPKNTEDPNMYIEGPGAVLVPIAIFR